MSESTSPQNPVVPYAAPVRTGLFARLRTWFLTGVLIVAPLALTLYVCFAIVSWVDQLIAPLIPPPYRPEVYFNLPFAVPGTGFVIVVVGLTLTGALAATLLGRFFVRASDRVLARLPIVRSLYGALKQMFETLLSQKSGAFRQVVLVPFPNPGSWAIGFLAGGATLSVQSAFDDEMVSVFLPTSPNPTSGYIVFVPRATVVPIDMTVEDGLKLVVSGGTVAAPSSAARQPARA
ncbi:MAG TPA: DUF502 domain-containing protein [Alphaproteobacteria bacterium]|jgi:uncharacterized membrane protein|nr:DUF502 domain-containing protein [Alphaproteobacteria bacterium]